MASDPSSEVCAVFLFPDSAEIRRLRGDAPRRGQRVRSMRGDVWFVTEVLRSGRNTYTVVCAGSDEFTDDVMHRRSRDLAIDLLSVVRKTIGSQEGVTLETPQVPPRGYMRSDWIEKYLFLGPQYGAHNAAPGNKPESDETDWLEAYLQRCRKQRQYGTASNGRWARLWRAVWGIEERELEAGGLHEARTTWR